MGFRSGRGVCLRKKSTVFILLITLLFDLTIGKETRPLNSIRLRYRPQAGSSNTYTLEVEASAKVVGMEEDVSRGVPQESRTFGKFILSDKILEVTPEGKIYEELTYIDVKLELEVAGRKEKLPFAEKLVGKSILIRIDSEGRVFSVEGLDRLGEEIKDLKIQEMYVQLRPIFPKKILRVGDRWENRTESLIPIGDMLVRAKVNEEYTLSGFEEKRDGLCAVITDNLKIETEGRTVKKTGAGDIEIDLRGEGSGKILYAFEKSKVVFSRIELELTSKIRSTAFREVEEIKMKHKIDMTLEEGVRME